jgi:hypothetical protein
MAEIAGINGQYLTYMDSAKATYTVNLAVRVPAVSARVRTMETAKGNLYTDITLNQSLANKTVYTL